MSVGLILCLVVGGLLAFITLILTLVMVDQQNVKIIQRFGKFLKLAPAGLNFKFPWIDWIAGEVALRVQELKVEVDTKTEDNVFVKVIVSVQYFVLQDKVFEAFYKLSNPTNQMSSYVFDVVRSVVPRMKLDDVFEKKDDIAVAVKKELSSTLKDFGYEISQALVVDIDPDKKVKDAMNEINAAQRLRIAANEKGEADKILAVKKAEGEAQSKTLQGQGIAGQRKAIIDGLKDSVGAFKESIGGSSQEVMTLVLLTQYFDTIKEIGASSKNTTLLIPHSPGAVADMGDQIRNALLLTKTDVPAASDKVQPNVKK